MSIQMLNNIGEAEKRIGAKFSLALKAGDKYMTTRIKKLTLAIHRQALKGISKRSFGELQKRYKPTRTVVASAPFDAPNTDRGDLVRSVDFELNKFSGVVGSNLPHARHLELGTENMAPRPWLTLALRHVSRNLKTILKLEKFDL